MACVRATSASLPLPDCRSDVACRIAASGLRSSCPSIARNRSFWRLASRNASSVRLRSVMSRAILEAPISRPSLPRMGEMVSDTSTRRPDLARRTVSKCSMRSPRLRRCQQPALFGVPLRRDDDVDRLPHHLLGGVAEETLGARIPGADRAVQQLADDRVVGARHHRRQEGVLLLDGGQPLVAVPESLHLRTGMLRIGHAASA